MDYQSLADAVRAFQLLLSLAASLAGLLRKWRRRRRVAVEPKWVGTRAVAEYFGISARTVRRLTREGVIPHRNLGPRLKRYDLVAVGEALRRRDVPAEGAAS